jgi:hypothetical protein
MKIHLLAAPLLALTLMPCPHVLAASPVPVHAAAAAQTQAAVSAVQAFLQTLNAEQRSQVQFAFTPQTKATAASFKGGKDGRMNFIGEQYGQAVWSNYPVSDVPRPGLAMGGLSAAQRGAAMRVLQTILSADGYRKIQDIMGADQVLSEGGTNYASGAAYYTIGIFGKPDLSSPWMVQFGGHHLGLNVVIAGAAGALTPTLTGAQPAVYQRDGKTVRVLAQENDKAFALLEALTPDQRKQAVLGYKVGDLVLGPGHDGEVIVPEGVKGVALDAHQKDLLLDLIGAWAGIIHGAYAGPRMAALRADLDQTYFAWSGPQTHAPGQNGAAYYRIQGPRVIIEFSPQGTGGDATMHVHTVYRDPTNAYGRALATP